VLTPAEVQAIDSALADARAEVARLVAVADELDRSRLPGWRWLFPSDERRTATTAASIVTSVERVGTMLAQAPAFDHEEAMRAVQLAREVATPGWTARALEGSTLGKVVADALPSAPSLPQVASWLKVLVVVVGLVAAAVLVAQLMVPLRFLFPRKA
jgi:hypothetical protein